MPLDPAARTFLASEIDLNLLAKLNAIINESEITFTVAWATLAALLASTICTATHDRAGVTDCAEIFGEFIKTFCAETDLGPEGSLHQH